ncbi:unnamed protein product [Oikopleura dioica]|uniref:LIM zinc-binding domain-containing protein n=1 Tax=Oikopleura dioica TaxID=34765 RepID=E4X8C8_OIKDI|nr:unnamed protein product [Oikopleura dioica]
MKDEEVCFEPFSKPCAKCKETIGYNGKEVCKELRFDGKPYHEWCLTCDICNVSIAGKLVKKKDSKIICEDCFRTHYMPKCSQCSEAFQQGDERILYDNQIFHQRCFVCSECSSPVDKNKFFKSDNKLKCDVCFSKKSSTLKTGTICQKCSKIIRDGAVAFRGKNYHRHCFTCKGGCGLELGGAEFAIKNGDCFCFECYISKFGRDCERCLEVVVGLGELRKITYENACWHPECFTCFECLMSLENQKFKQLCGEIYCLNAVAAHSMQSRHPSIYDEESARLGKQQSDILKSRMDSFLSFKRRLICTEKFCSI